MKVRLEVQFEHTTAEEKHSLRSVALGLTDKRDSVRVYAKLDAPDWLIAEFTMPRQRQIDAVSRIDRSFGFQMLNRLDSLISFPKSPAAGREAGKRRSETSR